MSEWKQVTKTSIAMLPRTGWKGAWDALVSAITGRPRYREETTLHFSVYVKNINNVPLELEIWGEQLEIGPKEEK